MNKQSLLIVGLGIVIVGGLVVLAVWDRQQSAGSSSSTTRTPSPTPTVKEAASTMVNNPTPTATPSGLIIEDESIGSGAEAVAGKSVTVDYTGTFTNGTKFDSSLDHGQPFTFTLGQGQVIAGWDEGVVGMKEGGKRKLTVPPQLGYGSQANGPIPANSTLVFEIELHSVK